MFLPARSPYDRQLLIECIVDRACTKGQVQTRGFWNRVTGWFSVEPGHGAPDALMRAVDGT